VRQAGLAAGLGCGKDRSAAAAVRAAVARGVVPRPMAGYGLPTCLRLTVGDRDENRRLLQALDGDAA